LRIASAIAAVMLLALPGLALAHPLGNFTVNHYAGIRVSPNRILVDAVVDRAEIPTFEARQDLDTDGDGEVSAAEADAGRRSGCAALASSLSLTVGGSRLALVPSAAGLAFPLGAGGLPTMRLVCELGATPATAIEGPVDATFADTGDADRVGWREVTVVGDGVAIDGRVTADSVSDRLTSYPTSLLQQPLGVRSVAFTARPGGPAAPPFIAPDAESLAGASVAADPAAVPTPAVAATAPAIAIVPGGIGADIDGLLRTQDLTPLVLLGSILAAIALGAGHAITPGHGKTLMGAYLIGARGTPVHAVGLGLAVAASHTAGIVVLALAVIGAGAALPPEQFQQASTIGSAAALTAVGAWLLAGRLRSVRRHAAATGRGHGGEHGHQHGHEHGHQHGHEHGHEHGHGPGRHTHGPGDHVPDGPSGDTALSWRSLAILGFAGGLVPSVNALLILLATIATNRAAFGLVLVVAFGLGMAIVMSGVGLALIGARDWLLARPRLPGLARFAELAPLGGAAFALVLGLVLTSQAVGGVRF
ncbi:MAG TPA: hypothetical protein VGK63_12280, partial [Candidatus Limnocylindrales bacterium]